MSLEIEKIKQASAYLAENMENLYSTKFLKLFYYLDFISVLERGVPVSNDVYYHLPFGPIPSFIKDQITLLKVSNSDLFAKFMGEEDKEKFSSVLSDVIDIQEEGGNKYIIKAKEGADDSLSYLSDYEKGLLDDLIEEFKDVKVKDIVEKTHKEVPYLQTPDSNTIDYRLAFYLKREDILPKRTYPYNVELSQAEFFTICR